MVNIREYDDINNLESDKNSTDEVLNVNVSLSRRSDNGWHISTSNNNNNIFF